MTILIGAAAIVGIAVLGSWVGDPFFRPDRDPGHWQTTVRVEQYDIGAAR